MPYGIIEQVIEQEDARKEAAQWDVLTEEVQA